MRLVQHTLVMFVALLLSPLSSGIVLASELDAGDAGSLRSGATGQTLSSSGLRATYFDGVDGSSVTRVDPTVDFDWGFGSPDPSIDADHFSIRWAGSIQPSESGTYTFYVTNHDDGFGADEVRLWINHQLVIFSWGDWVSERSARVVLTGGQSYDLRLEVMEYAGAATARLGWSTPSSGRAVIPSEVLRPSTGKVVSGTNYLSDLDWTHMSNGWGPAERDMNGGEPSGGDSLPLQMHGIMYPKGLGTSAVSDIRYNLDSQCARFQSIVGLDDWPREYPQDGGGSVIFRVFADGHLLYDSGVMTRDTRAKSVDLDIVGTRELRLYVDDAGDGIHWDQADWAGARVICAVGQ